MKKFSCLKYSILIALLLSGCQLSGGGGKSPKRKSSSTTTAITSSSGDSSSGSSSTSGEFTPELDEISVETMPTKTFYNEGDDFDARGLVIKRSFDDATEDLYTYTNHESEFSFNPSKNLKLEDTQVTVTYKGKTEYIDITVTPAPVVVVLSYISISGAKVKYTVGDSFEKPTVTAFYTDESSKTVTDQATFSGFNLATVGDQVVTVSYTEKDITKTITYEITVSETPAPTLSSISVETAPLKKSYIEGECFDPSGLIITRNYSDSTHDTYSYTNKTSIEFSFDPDLETPLTTTTTSVKIIYGEKYCYQNITVNAKVLSSITVNTAPTKTVYSVGDKFDPTGLVINRIYDFGSDTYSYAGHTSEFSFSPSLSTSLTKDNTSVTITYSGKSCTQTITVSESSDYWAQCEGLSGSALQAKILAINTPKNPSYDWDRYEDADEALDDSTSILCVYTRHNIKKNSHCGSSYSWDTWNREHVWTQSAYPKSKTDNHNIFACEGQINNDRGNLKFAEGGSTVVVHGHTTGCKKTSSSFEPCDEAKGEIARSVMYGTVMYSYTMTNEIDSIALALKWHLQHEITERETKRNDIVHKNQGNRNPFVDHPEYACKIWGGTNSDTKAICGMN